MYKLISLISLLMFSGCATKTVSFEKIYIYSLNIKETESDLNLKFNQNETPFFAITDRNSTIGGVFVFEYDNINGFAFIANETEHFNEKKELFDCDTNLSIIKPSFIIRSGELEIELTATLRRRCFYFK